MKRFSKNKKTKKRFSKNKKTKKRFLKKTFKNYKNYKKGGFKENINEIDFKYTINPARKVWVKNMYPHLMKFINIAADVKWNEYKFEGDVMISFNHYTGSEGAGYNPDLTNNFKDSVVPYEQIVRAVGQQTLNYRIIGGTCYELLSDIYKNVELSWFADPTGDIDVNCGAIPVIDHNQEIFNLTEEVRNKFKDQFSPYNIYPKIKLFTLDNKINPYYKHLLDWIFNNLRDKLELLNLNESFPNAVDFNINEYDEIPNEHRTPELGFNDIIIGKAHLISFIAENVVGNETDQTETGFNMIKVQLAFKIVDNGISIIDHVLEIMFNNDTNLISFGNKIGDYKFNDTFEIQPFERSFNIMKLDITKNGVLKTYNIDTIGNLMTDNLKAYKTRVIFIDNNDNNSIHKALNHIGRMFYIFDIIKNNKMNPQIKQITNSVMLGFSHYIIEISPNIKSDKFKECRLNKNIERSECIKYAENYVISNLSFKFYKMNAIDNGYIIYDIKVNDIIIAFIDIFVQFKPFQGKFIIDTRGIPGIFRNSITIPTDINQNEPYMNKEYIELMNLIKGNASRPSLNIITSGIKSINK